MTTVKDEKQQILELTRAGGQPLHHQTSSDPIFRKKDHENHKTMQRK